MANAFFPRGDKTACFDETNFITVTLRKAKMKWKAQDNTLSMKPGAIKYIKQGRNCVNCS